MREDYYEDDLTDLTARGFQAVRFRSWFTPFCRVGGNMVVGSRFLQDTVNSNRISRVVLAVSVVVVRYY